MSATFEDNRVRLHDLADKAIPGLKDNWTEAEEKLLTSIATGTDEFCAGSKGKQKIVRTELLEWLLAHPTPRPMLHPKGIQIHGMVVEQPLDLDSARIDIPIWMIGCTFKDDITMQRARIQHLSFQGSQCKSITADGIQIESSVFLSDNFKAEGEVRLLGAVIGGVFSCIKGEFKNPATDELPDASSLCADGINVKGGVFLRDGFKSEGEVRLLGAVIGGVLDCSNGEFKNPSSGERPCARALNADRINVQGGVFLYKGFKSEGEVRLLGAVIGGNLECDEGEFNNPSTDEHPVATALAVDMINVKGSIFLRNGFKSEGVVRLLGAVIGGTLDCSHGEFNNPATENRPGARALSADGIDVKGSVFLRHGFIAEGAVELPGAVIGGILDCSNGKFYNPVSIEIPKAIALDMYNVEVNGRLCLVHPTEHNHPAKIQGRVMLRHAAVGQLIDSAEVWEWTDETDNVSHIVPVALDGFTYDSFGLAEGAIDIEFRLRWLTRGRDFGELFAPQPYTQLANALRKAGHESEARQVFMARDWARLERVPMGKFDQGLGWLFGLTVGFGYRTRRAVIALFVLWFIGGFVFWGGWQADRFNPAVPFIYNSYYSDSSEGGEVSQVQRWPYPYHDFTEKKLKEYPVYHSWVYSFDSLMPIVNLHQEDYWIPTGFFALYMWAHILLGWFFTTMAVVGFTGLVRKE